MTAVSNTLLTAAQFNVHVRDNLLATEASRAVNPGWFWVAEGPNRSAERQIGEAVVNASESTTSTTYIDLATRGPELTITLVQFVLVGVGATIENSTTARSAATYTIEHADPNVGFTAEPFASHGITRDGGGGTPYRMGAVAARKLGGPGKGVYKVRMVYRVTGATGTYDRRRVQVMSL